jgi:hypothetical protein
MIRLTVAAAAILLTAATSTDTPPARGNVYTCQERIAPFGKNGVLTIYKSINPDGSTFSLRVQWEDGSPTIVSRATPNDQVFLTLDWPGDQTLGADYKPLDWSTGSIKITYLPASPNNRFVRRKNELWSQAVVDRNGSIRSYDDKGVRYVWFSGLDLFLTNDPVSGSGRFSMSLDNFLAWGSGVDHVTVYELAIARRQKPPGSSDTNIGAKRVVASYRVDMVALAAMVRAVRDKVTAWEASLVDFKTRCRLEPTPSVDDIVIT